MCQRRALDLKSLATKAVSSSHTTCLSVQNLKDEFSTKHLALKMNIKLGFGKESVFLHRKVLWTFNYEAASQRSFALVAIRNWVILARALVKLQVPPSPLPASSSNWLTSLRFTGLNFEMVLTVQWLGCTSENVCMDRTLLMKAEELTDQNFQGNLSVAEGSNV